MVMNINTHWTLPPRQRAVFATSSRLLSSLTTESLLDTLYIPISIPSCQHLIGIAVLLALDVSHARSPYDSADIFAIVPLRHVPIFKPNTKSLIGLLDPLDMLPFVYEPQDKQLSSRIPGDLAVTMMSALAHSGLVSKDVVFLPSLGPLHLWNKYAGIIGLDSDSQKAIAAELNSSFLWQQYSYENPPPAPAFDSPSIVWEQCLIEAHPTHPMHKARCNRSPTPPVQPGQYDWLHPRIRMVSVPCSSMNVHGPWDTLIAPVRDAVVTHAKHQLEIPQDHVLVPVHELQLPSIRDKFREAQIFPPEFALAACAQQSLRSVTLPDVLSTHTLKVSLNTRVTSSLRVISPHSAAIGPAFCRDVLPRLIYDRTLLRVLQEPASVSHVHPDSDTAGLLGAIVREACELDGEQVIVCTALTEMGHSAGKEVPLVQTVFGLDTQEKRLAFLDKYSSVLFAALLPPLFKNGLAFQAHPQNTLARFDMRTRSLTGFAVRDCEGVRVHLETLCASTGLAFNADGDAGTTGLVTGRLDATLAREPCAMPFADVHARLYHALVHNHLQQLIRVLGLHYNGAGWACVRRHLNAQLPADPAIVRLWNSPTQPGKCFIRMRLQELHYTTKIQTPFPNLILYEGGAQEFDDKVASKEQGHLTAV